MRRSLAPLLLVLAWPFLAATPQTEGAAPRRKVLIIGTDGTRLDAVEKAKTPNLDRLIENGTLFRGTRILDAGRKTKPDTVSGPGWSNIYTGVWPDKHGVMDNKFQGSHYDEFPCFFVRLKEARPEAKTANFSSWDPIHQRIVAGADVSRDFLLDDKGDWVEADVESTQACVEYLRTEDPTAVVLYLGQVDETGHKHGFHPNVPEYIAAIERMDGHVGEAVAAIQSRKTFADEDWLVIVGTDHGGRGLNHGGGHEFEEITQTFLIVSGPDAARGESTDPTGQVDIVATALTHLGVPLKPEWKLDGKPVGLKK